MKKMTRPRRAGWLALISACTGIVSIAIGVPLASASPSSEKGKPDPYLISAIAAIVTDGLDNAASDGTLGDFAQSQLDLTTCLTKCAMEQVGSNIASDVEGGAIDCAATLDSVDPTVGRRFLASFDVDRLVGVLDAESAPHQQSAPHVPKGAVPVPNTQGRPTPRSDAKVVPPTTGIVTSLVGDGRGHGGIDIANSLGTPIVAVAEGTVISAGPAQGFGLWIRIRHDDGTITTYGHNQGNNVSSGQRVGAGDQIASVGNRGNSTGPHLHFEVESASGEQVDPTAWLAARGASISDDSA